MKPRIYYYFILCSSRGRTLKNSTPDNVKRLNIIPLNNFTLVQLTLNYHVLGITLEHSNIAKSVTRNLASMATGDGTACNIKKA